MLNINDTPFAAVGFEQLHRDGQRMAVVALRAGYDLYPDGTIEKAARQDLCLADIYDGPPQIAPLVRVSDLVPFRPTADVTVLGDAFAPDGRSMPNWEVGVQVEKHAHVLRVNGPRNWQPSSNRRAPTWTLDQAKPVDRVALDYRLAAGGRVIGHPTGEVDARNPIGVGIIDPTITSHLSLYAAAQVDSEFQPVESVSGKPVPQGFGPVPAAWAFRSHRLGTIDNAWMARPTPGLPSDHDYRYWQCAHPELILANYLKAGNKVVLARLTPNKEPVRFSIPDEEPYVIFKWIDGREVKARMNRDGLHIDLRGGAPWRVEITFRCWIEICPRFLRADVALGHEAELSDLPTAGEHGLQEA